MSTRWLEIQRGYEAALVRDIELFREDSWER